VIDPEKYQQYLQRVPETISRFGGRYLARGNRVLQALGDWNPERMILLEFSSPENICRWLSSPEYQAIKRFREEGADTRAIIVEGDID
jgi:uncharacterized protein (DUF1330 family)